MSLPAYLTNLPPRTDFSPFLAFQRPPGVLSASSFSVHFLPYRFKKFLDNNYLSRLEPVRFSNASL
jgi:hypothetical protein